MTQSNEARRLLAICAVLTSAILAAYWGIWRFDFISCDDPQYVTENPQVLEGLTIEGIKWAFTSGHASNWHPLTWLSLMTDRELFGVNAGGFHAVNLLLHIINSILLLIVLFEMSGDIWASALAATLFALHPLHVESVVWVTERKDVLSTLFWMLTMLAYVRYVERPTIRRYVVTAVIFAMGLLAKPMLVTLPFVLILLDYWPLGRMRLPGRSGAGGDKTLVGLFVEKIWLFILSGASSVATFMVQKQGGAVKGFESFALWDRVTNAVVSYAWYMQKMFRPAGLAIFYPHPRGQLSMLQVGISLAILLAVTVLVIWQRRRRRYLPVGWLWYLGTLVPVIGLVQVGGQAMADRYTYVPLVGLFIMVAWLVRDAVAGARYAKAAAAIAAVIICIGLTALTREQAGYWRGSLTLFERALNVTTDNYFAYNQVGVAMGEAGETEKAIGQFEEALRIRGNDIDAHYNLAKALAKVGRSAESMEHYNQVLALRPTDADTYNALALQQVEDGALKEAEDIYRQGLSKNPESALLHSRIGVVLMKMGRLEDAIAELRTGVKLGGDSAAYGALALAISQGNEADKAEGYFEKAIRMDPKNAETQYNFGNLLLSQDRLGEAIEKYENSIRAKPDYAKAYGNLAIALVKSGLMDGAIDNFKKAVELEPNSVEAHFNLARAFSDKGDIAKAIEHLRKVVELSPQDVAAHNQLAGLLLKEGQVEQATAEYEQTLKIDPNNEEAQAGLKKVQSIKTDGAGRASHPQAGHPAQVAQATPRGAVPWRTKKNSSKRGC